MPRITAGNAVVQVASRYRFKHGEAISKTTKALACAKYPTIEWAPRGLKLVNKLAEVNQKALCRV